MIGQDEVEIAGCWEMKAGRMIEDVACLRIRQIVATQFKQLSTSNDGWEKLFQDLSDNRLWELTYPQSQMQGGGPPALRVIESETAAKKYRLYELSRRA